MKKFFAVAALILGVVVSQLVAVQRAEAISDGLYSAEYYRCHQHGEVIIAIWRIENGDYTTLIGWVDINLNSCESAAYYNENGHNFGINKIEVYLVVNGQWTLLNRTTY